MSRPAQALADPSTLRHVRAPVPLWFAVSMPVSESKTHLILRTFLWQLIAHVLGPEHTVGCDQFVYFAADDPVRCLSPDVFVKLRVPDEPIRSWNCWQRGAPELGVEIVSLSDTPWLEWEKKFERYRAMGVEELVRFDRESPAGQRLRVWDRFDGDLVERVVEGDATPCRTLGLTWVVAPAESERVALRLARADGTLVPTALEEERAARELAEARIRELEEAFRRKQP